MANDANNSSKAAEARKKMMQYFEEMKPFLTAQLEHQKLVTAIEQARADQLSAQVEIAQITNTVKDLYEQITKDKKEEVKSE